jgi:hypothetical protein
MYVNRDGISYEQGHIMTLRLFEAQYNSVRITLFYSVLKYIVAEYYSLSYGKIAYTVNPH